MTIGDEGISCGDHGIIHDPEGVQQLILLVVGARIILQEVLQAQAACRLFVRILAMQQCERQTMQTNNLQLEALLR